MNKGKIKIAVCGANGKMGQEVIKAVSAAEDMELAARIDIVNGEFASVEEAKEAADIDILIDFTQPASIYGNALYCLNNGINLVIGTTGLNDEQIKDMVMTNQDYIRNIARLKEIEAIVKNPESSLDKIDELIDETRRLVTECYGYTRTLKQKVDSLADIDKEISAADTAD